MFVCEFRMSVSTGWGECLCVSLECLCREGGVSVCVCEFRIYVSRGRRVSVCV